MTIGARLRTLRLKAGYATPADLAVACDPPLLPLYVAVQEQKHWGIDPNDNRVRALAAALGVSVEALAGVPAKPRVNPLRTYGKPPRLSVEKQAAADRKRKQGPRPVKEPAPPRPLETRACANPKCEATFECREGATQRYCTQPCRERARHSRGRQWAGRPKAEPHATVCQWAECGQPLPEGRRALRRYCGDKCAQAAGHRRERDRKREGVAAHGA